MSSLVDSDIQRFVACLVLGYLENQQLQKTYNSFCETSRHLVKEKKGLKYGTKPLDTSAGLINIIKEYFLFKARINEFLRVSPQTPIIYQLIDTEDTLDRLDIILKAFREAPTKVPVQNTKKRKLEDEEVFDISQSNTSTPETFHPTKRMRKSLTTPFLTLSANKEVKSKSIDRSKRIDRAELNYQCSSSDTSGKDEDIELDKEIEKVSLIQRSVSNMTPPVLKTSSTELLSKTILNNPHLIEKMVNVINETRSGRESAPTTSSVTQENGLTDNDLENILSVTQNDPSFDEIVNDVINKYLVNHPEEQESPSTSTSSDKQVSKAEDVPLKQRLRPRSERKPPMSAKKKKITIISNEPYTGVVPALANMPSLSVVGNSKELVPAVPQQVLLDMPIFVPNGSDIFSVVQAIPTTSSGIISNAGFISNQTASCEIPINQIINAPPTSIVQIPIALESLSRAKVEKKETTPKTVLYPNFLEMKSKSASRKKDTHVRILDFNQTPSARRLAGVPECLTPSNRIPMITPGSAPANLSMFQSVSKNREQAKEVEVEAQVVPESVVDDNSNSNSISNTPKVAKNRRRRKIAETKEKVDEKAKAEEELTKPFTIDDWKKMRSQSKNVPIDHQIRIVIQQADIESPHKMRNTGRRPKKRFVRKSKSLTKSPINKKDIAKKDKKSPSVDHDENIPLIKFRISSPRKVAASALKSLPKKKKKTVIERSKEKLKVQVNQKSKEKEVVASVTPVATLEAEPEICSELNRSDTVQDVALMLTNLPETILANDNGSKSLVKSIPEANQDQADSGIEPNAMLETPFKDLAGMIDTPFKDSSITPLPNTPRFAIPLTSHETPMVKIFPAGNPSSLSSLVKALDIFTPSFPITPGFTMTPPKDVNEVSPSASGYSSRRTDYSSCSSYYKPDESEDINQNLNAILSQRKGEINSQSESDEGAYERPLKILESVKKVECPGAIERVKSFTEVQLELPTPHYTMMDGGLLSESMVTATDDSTCSSSSSFTCSTCSSGTYTSDNENTMEKLNKASKTDSEWDFDDPVMAKEVVETPAVMNEVTGEVRFPLRNWITPRKVEELQEPSNTKETVIAKPLNPPKPVQSIDLKKEREKRLKDMENLKIRMLEKLRKDSAEITSKSQPKFKKTNVKNFKLPEEALKPTAFSRKEQILQQSLTERPRPTPLKLIPSSSSRRKNATPRKTIVIDELPRQPTGIKKKKASKNESPTKSPSKSERLSMESAGDNAIMPEESTKFETSSSFNTSTEDDTVNTVVAQKTPEKPKEIKESNTFQKSLKAQGFEKIATKELQSEFVDDQPKSKELAETAMNESDDESDDESDEEEDELEVCLSDVNEKHVFVFIEADNFQPRTPLGHKLNIPPTIINFDDRKVTLQASENMDLFSMDSREFTKTKNYSQKQTNHADEQPAAEDLSFSDANKPQQNFTSKDIAISSPPINLIDISAILDKVHGK